MNPGRGVVVAVVGGGGQGPVGPAAVGGAVYGHSKERVDVRS